ncbi:MAG: 50S ribosomal protein L6 [Microthrixaceae bacterium]|nr:50S ribosomal protein L6 [Microthrixaceae bacterium]MCO5314333.1 50S ribosomal protein L6 [Microthrixaceae bacterium]
MSRIGKAPIPVPAGVTVTIADGVVAVKGPKGELSREIPGAITVRQSENEVIVERPDDERANRALHGMFRSLINNMVVGVTEGFRKDLEIVGVGYRAAAKGSNALDLQLGFSHPVSFEAPAGIEFVVPAPTKIEVHGIDKVLVGQVAANIRSIRKPEPYKGKGVRYSGEHVRRKAGKAGK